MSVTGVQAAQHQKCLDYFFGSVLRIYVPTVRRHRDPDPLPHGDIRIARELDQQGQSRHLDFKQGRIPKIGLKQNLSLDGLAILIRIMQEPKVLRPNSQRYITPGLTARGHFTADVSER